ncbi:alpha/beta hydrolase [Caballeronia ptereochthonis]|uniref:Phospholipase/Carboxylesterase n=1 Tax=Caballeronia ptereochthonis TaxID=1777144 RepID=A0A158C2M4_9BURK|nr:dienelactone hydrolase family protein [Caballeronia ptereochthonis]SAK76615.1 Phospholipase/Carboxylesterase [Caballeronia ptereochthonis]
MKNPHLVVPVVEYGAPVEDATLAVILVHGRGQSPDWMYENVVRRFDVRNLAWRAPAAGDSSWYPERFIAPVELNEPRLSYALACVDAVSEDLRRRGMPYESQVLMGFSQGACLCSEFVWRAQRRYRALVSFTGALIGPPDTVRDPSAFCFENMPVLFSSWDQDPYVPAGEVEKSAELFRKAGAAVKVRVDPGTEHGIRDAEIGYARSLVDPGRSN